MIIIIVKWWQRHEYPWFSLAIRPYRLSFWESRLGGVQWLYTADEYKFLLVDEHWCVYALESIKER